jgi:hypothetical protein
MISSEELRLSVGPSGRSGNARARYSQPRGASSAQATDPQEALKPRTLASFLGA